MRRGSLRRRTQRRVDGLVTGVIYNYFTRPRRHATRVTRHAVTPSHHKLCYIKIFLYSYIDIPYILPLTFTEPLTFVNCKNNNMHDFSNWASSVSKAVATVKKNQDELPRAFKRLKGNEVSEVKLTECEGDNMLKHLLVTLDSFKDGDGEFVQRTETQKKFHTAFIEATLPHIYGVHDFERHYERILRDHNIEKLQQEVLICTPRRFGKTWSVSMFCAALLLCTREAWISVFSTGQRASSYLLENVAKFVKSCPDGQSRILKHNKEELYLRGTTPEEPPRRLYSYPSSVQVRKGLVDP